MRIGFVSTWLERGAAYVTKSYISMLKSRNELFVFARGGEYLDKNMTCDGAKITYGYRLQDTDINWHQFCKWIKRNSLDIVIFNEQTSMECVYKARRKFPGLLLGAYIDYYTEETVDSFKYYHFLLCNTKRHFNVFKWHPGAYYLPWGCDLDVFKPKYNKKTDGITFFHSMGMSSRKGTDTLIRAFIEGEFYKKNAKLIIHTQKNINELVSSEDAKNNNIQIINRTVSHPGLYYMGDVYVYPTLLDGLGLTIYEALASGLPVITTDAPPMNEVVSEKEGNGKLVKVAEQHCRKDAYYWPLSFVDQESLIDCMSYYCDRKDNIVNYQKKAREYAEKKLNILSVSEKLNNIMKNIMVRKNELLGNDCNNPPRNMAFCISKKVILNHYLPDILLDFIRRLKEQRNGRK